MNKGELVVWLAGLADDSDELRAVAAIRAGGGRPADEPLLTLRGVGALLGYRSPVTLHRLQVQRVGVSWAGGRLRYRRSDVERYLASSECAVVRAELRQARRARMDREGVAR